VLRRGRAASALVAMVVAAAVTTAMLNLSVDVQAKLRKEFRNYGANIVVVAKDAQSLPADALEKVRSVLGGHGLAVPFAYVVARTSTGQPVVVSGTDFDEVQKLNRWWSVSSWPHATHDALVGTRAVAAVAPQGQPFDLSFRERTIHLNSAGTLRTGAAEDSRVYISLSNFQTWTDIKPSTIEISATGSSSDIAAMVQKVAEAVPSAEVRPVRQIMEGEALVLGKTRATVTTAAALIIATAALCLLSTLLGWVFDRRRDFAIMKALGASGRLIGGFVAAEAAALGAVGAVIGFAIGIAIAALIGRINFHAPVVPRFDMLPIVLAGGVVVALISSVIPIFLLQRVEPAMILKGE